jgi:hypothetical protein
MRGAMLLWFNLLAVIDEYVCQLNKSRTRRVGLLG